MAKKAKISEKYQVWIDARKRFHLCHVHIQMARELDMNPKRFGKKANHKQGLFMDCTFLDILLYTYT
jgi:hypothetical protein